MRYSGVTSVIATAIVLAVSAHPTWAKGLKSGARLMQHSVTGSHFKKSATTARTSQKSNKKKSGKPNVSDISITKTIDESSP